MVPTSKIWRLRRLDLGCFIFGSKLLVWKFEISAKARIWSKVPWLWFQWPHGSPICLENYWSTLVTFRCRSYLWIWFLMHGLCRSNFNRRVYWVTITWLSRWYGETAHPLNVIFLRRCKAVLGAATSCGLRGQHCSMLIVECAMSLFVSLQMDCSRIHMDGLSVMRANRCCQWRTWQRQWGAAWLLVVSVCHVADEVRRLNIMQIFFWFSSCQSSDLVLSWHESNWRLMRILLDPKVWPPWSTVGYFWNVTLESCRRVPHLRRWSQNVFKGFQHITGENVRWLGDWVYVTEFLFPKNVTDDPWL